MKELPEHLKRQVDELKRLLRASMTYGAYSPRFEEIWRAFKKAGFEAEYARIHAEVKHECRPFGVDGFSG